MEEGELRYVPTAALIPYANNARVHSDSQIAQIAASIKEFGFNNPILTDGGNGVIAGHGRLLAAQKLGSEEVPVIELTHLSETQKKAYILADNKIALNAGWDDELLGLELGEIKGLDFDLDITGFSAEDVVEINSENIDIEEVDHFNETFGVTISCADLGELAIVQQAIGCSGKKIDAKRFLEAIA